MGDNQKGTHAPLSGYYILQLTPKTLAYIDFLVKPALGGLFCSRGRFAQLLALAGLCANGHDSLV